MTINREDLQSYIRELERRIFKLETAPRAPYTSILNEAGEEVTRLSQDGLTIAEGGIWVGGGPVRAIDFAFTEGDSANVSLSTTAVEAAIAVLIPPSWATTVVLQVFSLVQMRNNTASPQAIAMRAMAHGVPPSGLWTDDVGPTEWGTQVDYYQRTLTRGVHFTTSVTASTAVGVTVGTNSQNYVRTKATAYFLR